MMFNASEVNEAPSMCTTYETLKTVFQNDPHVFLDKCM